MMPSRPGALPFAENSLCYIEKAGFVPENI
jgi:hypothetical protein